MSHVPGFSLIWVFLLSLICLSMSTCLAVHQDVQHRLACHQLQIRGLLWRFPHVAEVRKMLGSFRLESVQTNTQSQMSVMYKRLTLLTWRWHAIIHCCSCRCSNSYLDCNDDFLSYRCYHFNLYLNQQMEWKAENWRPYCNNTSAGIRFSDQQMHTRQPSQCKMCRSVGLLNK